MTAIDYQLERAPQRIIRGTVSVPDPSAWPAPVVLFCHPHIESVLRLIWAWLEELP